MTHEPTNTPTVFDSTVAVTLYNILCKRPGLEKDALMQAAIGMQHADLHSSQFVRALAGLISRGRIHERGSKYHPADRERRLVVQRNTADHKLGHEGGGWSGWLVEDLSTGSRKLRTLESVLEEVVP